jgi:transposase-like protein
MSKEPQAKRETFGEVFLERLETIIDDANRAGINLTKVCARAGISRATPDRWRRKLPKTIEIIDTMEEVIVAHKKAEARKR